MMHCDGELYCSPKAEFAPRISSSCWHYLPPKCVKSFDSWHVLLCCSVCVEHYVWSLCCNEFTKSKCHLGAFRMQTLSRSMLPHVAQDALFPQEDVAHMWLHCPTALAPLPVECMTSSGCVKSCLGLDAIRVRKTVPSQWVPERYTYHNGVLAWLASAENMEQKNWAQILLTQREDFDGLCPLSRSETD